MTSIELGWQQTSDCSKSRITKTFSICVASVLFSFFWGVVHFKASKHPVACALSPFPCSGKRVDSSQTGAGCVREAGEKMDAMFGPGTSLARQDTRTVTLASWAVWQLAVTVCCNDLSSCALGTVKLLGGGGGASNRGVKGGGCGWGVQGGQMPAETVGGERVSLQPSGS